MKSTPSTAIPPLKEAVYSRYMKFAELVGLTTDLNVKISEEANALQDGDIYLFNHFTRFETIVIPPLIYQKTGKLCRSVAHQDLFKVNSTLGSALFQMGAVPHNTPDLLPFLAKEILRGHKIVIFPEGGMVKDKRVMDDKGNYRIYSNTSGAFRKHHRGAAVLAVTLDAMKIHLRSLFDAENLAGIDNWCTELRLTRAELKLAADKPTLIVPGSITFYPIRTRESLLAKGIGKFLPNAPAQAVEELIIESNILFRSTDMNIHFGHPFNAIPPLRLPQKLLINQALKSAATMEDVFMLHEANTSWSTLYYKQYIDSQVERIRSTYGKAIYQGLTLNLNHLVSTFITLLVEKGQMQIPADTFHRTLYAALKTLQGNPKVRLHCSLARVPQYRGLIDGKPAGFKGFIETCVRAKLLTVEDGIYHLSHRLKDETSRLDVRLENPVQIHANEAAPFVEIKKTLSQALSANHLYHQRAMAAYLWDDELRDYDGQRRRFSKKAPQTLFNGEDDSAGKPYLLLPAKPAKTGLLLIHGFSATPAELRPFAESAFARGYAVLGLRLPGHGTSHLEMEDRTAEDWQEAVQRGITILGAHVEKIVLVGFSTGGALALQAASQNPAKVVGAAALSAPVKITDRKFMILPVAAAIQKVLRKLPFCGNLLRFHRLWPDNTGMHYTMMPVQGLNQLHRMIKTYLANVAAIKMPVLLLQGSKDATVTPGSVTDLYSQLGSPKKELVWVESGLHNLLRENPRTAYKHLLKFIRTVETA